MSHSGYLEGQLYSTSGEFTEGYYEDLKRLGKVAYTSPDITVLNRWDKPATDLDKRFGIACSRRDTVFDRDGKSTVTFPRYQSHALKKIQDSKGLPIYIAFGRKVADSFAVGMTELRKPDEVVKLPEQSTKTYRWNDIFYVDRLWSWTNFIAERIGMGDHEPTIDAAKKLNIRQLW